MIGHWERQVIRASEGSIEQDNNKRADRILTLNYLGRQLIVNLNVELFCRNYKMYYNTVRVVFLILFGMLMPILLRKLQ